MSVRTLKQHPPQVCRSLVVPAPGAHSRARPEEAVPVVEVLRGLRSERRQAERAEGDGSWGWDGSGAVEGGGARAAAEARTTRMQVRRREGMGKLPRWSHQIGSQKNQLQSYVATGCLEERAEERAPPFVGCSKAA